MMNETYNFGNGGGTVTNIVITYDEVLKQVSQEITSQLLIIGVAATLCALWHMFVRSREDQWYIMATNAIDMCMFMAGTYLIALYAVAYWGLKLW